MLKIRQMLADRPSRNEVAEPDLAPILNQFVARTTSEIFNITNHLTNFTDQIRTGFSTGHFRSVILGYLKSKSLNVEYAEKML